MTDYTVKSEDGLPTFQRELGIDLTQADEVRLYVEDAADETLVVNDTATIVDQTTGVVQYDFSASQTANVGYHNAEFVVTINGEERTFPNDGFYILEFTHTTNRDGNVDPDDPSVTFSGVITTDEIRDNQGNVIYNYSNQHVPLSILQEDTLTITAGDLLTGGGPVALGSSTTIDVDLWDTTTVTSDYTASIYENILADANGGPLTITLPEPSNDLEIVVKKIDSSENNVTVQPFASQTIDGKSSLMINSEYTARTITSDGTDYYII
jgi:hypothetical protein